MTATAWPRQGVGPAGMHTCAMMLSTVRFPSSDGVVRRRCTVPLRKPSRRSRASRDWWMCADSASASSRSRTCVWPTRARNTHQCWVWRLVCPPVTANPNHLAARTETCMDWNFVRPWLCPQCTNRSPGTVNEMSMAARRRYMMVHKQVPCQAQTSHTIATRTALQHRPVHS